MSSVLSNTPGCTFCYRSTQDLMQHPKCYNSKCPHSSMLHKDVAADNEYKKLKKEFEELHGPSLHSVR